MQGLERIGIILKPSEIENFDVIITNLIRWLSKREKKVSLLDQEQKRLRKLTPKALLEKVSFVTEQELYGKSDMVISLGGDGTLLGVSRKISPDVPIFSVNLGRLGFITRFSKVDFYEHLNTVFAGKFQTKKTFLNSVEIIRDDRNQICEYFFNDAVLSKNSIARMVSLSVEVNQEHMQDIVGDGIIVSSTFGSTAYSLAAGGPIVHPEVEAYILTPICPHSLTRRPVVISDKSHIDIKLIDEIDDVHVTLDGQQTIPVQYRDVVRIKKSSRYITTILNEEQTYFQTLKEKFNHGK